MGGNLHDVLRRVSLMLCTRATSVLILIRDIDHNIAFSFISSFADDTRVGRHIEDFEDIQLLQADLDAVYNWAESNNMEFNSDKFELLRYRLWGSTVQNLAGFKSNIGSEIEETAMLRIWV